MKLTKNTLDVLKNFATINQGIIIDAGDKLRTISVAKDVLATAKVDVTFPVDFAIYDLNEFLSTLSLFENPELDFEDNNVKISSGKSNVYYYYSSPTVIVAPPAQANFPDADLEFELDNVSINSLRKASSIMKLDELNFTGDGSNITCTLLDTTNTTSNKYELEIASDVEEFSATMRMMNLNLIPSDYDVNVGRGTYIQFTNGDISYWIGLEE